ARMPSSSLRRTGSSSASGVIARPPTPTAPGRSGHAWSSSWTVRSHSTSTRPPTSCSSRRSCPRRSMPTEGHIAIYALAGIPEIQPGDDLPAILCDALERTTDALPLRPDDVLVVTQKIVSKEEGAVVDLRTINPRQEAVEFARTYARDARQIEVVLREARRVVRMANGVLITETPHGFVCANGGVDASNVGPGSGDVVTLLPVDPDAS